MMTPLIGRNVSDFGENFDGWEASISARDREKRPGLEQSSFSDPRRDIVGRAGASTYSILLTPSDGPKSTPRRHSTFHKADSHMRCSHNRPTRDVPPDG
jgi:hypothetical protein